MLDAVSQCFRLHLRYDSWPLPASYCHNTENNVGLLLVDISSQRATDLIAMMQLVYTYTLDVGNTFY